MRNLRCICDLKVTLGLAIFLVTFCLSDCKMYGQNVVRDFAILNAGQFELGFNGSRTKRLNFKAQDHFVKSDGNSQPILQMNMRQKSFGSTSGFEVFVNGKKTYSGAGLSSGLLNNRNGIPYRNRSIFLPGNLFKIGSSNTIEIRHTKGNTIQISNVVLFFPVRI